MFSRQNQKLDDLVRYVSGEIKIKEFCCCERFICERFSLWTSTNHRTLVRGFGHYFSDMSESLLCRSAGWGLRVKWIFSLTEWFIDSSVFDSVILLVIINSLIQLVNVGERIVSRSWPKDLLIHSTSLVDSTILLVSVWFSDSFGNDKIHWSVIQHVSVWISVFSENRSSSFSRSWRFSCFRVVSF